MVLLLSLVEGGAVGGGGGSGGFLGSLSRGRQCSPKRKSVVGGDSCHVIRPGGERESRWREVELRRKLHVHIFFSFVVAI